MSERPWHRIERWEYDAGRDLLVALLDDDRNQYDACVDAHDLDRPPVLADLIAIALRVAEVKRFQYYIVHRRPGTQAIADFLNGLAESQFTDLFDRDLANGVIKALYQRPRPLLVPSNDLTSMTTCLAVASWRLWISRQGLFPLDRHTRCRQTYSAIAATMRVQGARVPAWMREDGP